MHPGFYHFDLRRRGRVAVTMTVALTLSACSPRAAAVANYPEPPADQVMAALTDAWPRPRPDAPTLYAPPEPSRLRPCCAFGYELKVKIGSVPVPGVALETVRGLGDVGPHEYSPGLLQVAPGPVQPEPKESGAPSREHNGLAYTCRGGFIDTAHLRDFSDLTWFLAAQVERRLETGGTIELSELGGTRRIVLQPIDRQRIENAGRIPLSIAIAQWLTFELSLWREIATWYGHESVPPWPEKISAFSIEDLYSNLVGTKVAAGIILAGGVHDEVDYDRAMSAWVPATLNALGIVPKDSAADAMRSVDGIWWDSTRRIPDWKLVRRRKLDLGPALQPWLVTMADGPRPAPSLPCPGTDSALVLRRRESLAGISIPAEVAVEIRVDDVLTRHGFPFPRPGDRRVTLDDLPAIVEDIRRENDAAFAAPSDQPRRARNDAGQS